MKTPIKNTGNNVIGCIELQVEGPTIREKNLPKSIHVNKVFAVAESYCHLFKVPFKSRQKLEEFYRFYFWWH
jgi:hypothetical protein